MDKSPRASTSTKLDFTTEDGDGYDSDFEDPSYVPGKSSKNHNKQSLTSSSSSASRQIQKPPPKSFFHKEQRRAEGWMNRYFALNAYERHQKLINDYMLYYPGSAEELLKRDTSKDKNDYDIIREHHRFIWNESDDSTESQTWEKDLAKKYYDKLFKEYGVCDLSRYNENKIAIRWRVQTEVVDGNGQFTCGEKKCPNSNELRTWEVNFAYLEERIKKNALVKLRLCPDCSVKLNFCHKRKEVTKQPKKRKSSSRRSKHSKKSKRSDRDDTFETSSSQGEGSTTKSEEQNQASENIWKDPVVLPELKSRDEEFDEYLEDLFL